MASISRKIKNKFYSKSTPDFLFNLYFNWKNKKDKKKLFKILESKVDLMNEIPEKTQLHWSQRIQNVLDDPNNIDIPRHNNAGQLIDNLLQMHNGILIDPLSYYNLPMLKMLMDNKGVHEPQEEKIFQEVLKNLTKKSEMTMLELGAYWSFYSIWFKKVFPEAQCFMVEPDRKNLVYGKRNFKLNNQKGIFIHAGISSQNNIAKGILTVDSICSSNKIKFLDILHADIQGFELEMLHGSDRMLSEKRIGYVFISTHSNNLHVDCQKLLEEKYDFSLVASADLDESFSWDGILVMKARDYNGIDRVSIAKRVKKTI